MRFYASTACRRRHGALLERLAAAGWEAGLPAEAGVALLDGTGDAEAAGLPPDLPMLCLVERRHLPRLRGHACADFLVLPTDAEELLLRLNLRARPPGSRPGEDERLRVQREAAGWLRRFAGREEELLSLWLTDPETGLFNRPYFALKLSEEIRRTERYQVPVSTVLVRVTPGREGGERATRLTLKEVAGILLRECRDVDLLARCGPAEFGLLLPSTGPDGAVLLAQRLAERIVTHAYAENRAGRDFHLRAGVATYPAPGVIGARGLLRRAGEALAKAADHPRPEICIWEG